MERFRQTSSPVAGREAVANYFYERLQQINHEIALLLRVPEQGSLLGPREANAQVYSRAIQVINAGYDPFVPNPSWYQGFLEVAEAPGGMAYKLFTWPMPPHAVAAYEHAQALGLFDVLTVHSPFAEAFETRYTPLPPRPPQADKQDPVLVGWLNAFIGKRNDGPELVVKKLDNDVEMVGFLLADWDLKEDLRMAK